MTNPTITPLLAALDHPLVVFAGIVVFIGLFGCFMAWLNTRPRKPESHSGPVVVAAPAQPVVWSKDDRERLLRDLGILEMVIGGVKNSLLEKSQGDFKELLLNTVPRLTAALANRFCLMTGEPDSLNVGVWFRSQHGGWHRTPEQAGAVSAVRVSGQEIQVKHAQSHLALQANARQIPQGHSGINWKPMTSCPDNIWVLLQVFDKDGNKLMVVGFIKDRRRHDGVCFDGTWTVGIGSDEYTLDETEFYTAYAPLLVNNA